MPSGLNGQWPRYGNFSMRNGPVWGEEKVGSTEILVSGGVAALLAALAGGGLKAFGVEVPALASLKRQALLAVVGIGLILIGLTSWSGQGEESKTETGGSLAEPVAPVEAGKELAQARGSPEVPNIYDLPFPAARQFLMQNGWAPIRLVSPMGNEQLGLRQEEIFESGYLEAVSCSGAQTAPCLFRYRNPQGFVLEVVTVGEELASAVVNSATILDCSKDPKPDGC